MINCVVCLTSIVMLIINANKTSDESQLEEEWMEVIIDEIKKDRCHVLIHVELREVDEG